EGHHVVFATHHPLITAGPHGGHFTWRQHLFPLQDFVPWLWLPLPVIGSLYPLSRQLGVTGTDVTSEPYQRFITAIYRAATPRAPMAIVAGHEHSLQVHQDGLGLYYLVSGAGSAKKVNRVEKEKGFREGWLKVAAALPGYMRLDAYADGSLGATVFALDVDVFPLDVLDGEELRRPIYRTCLADGPPKRPQLR
ncbi:MAG: hypothetical protein V3U03_06990, partial [Myxococcota bacterium]